MSIMRSIKRNHEMVSSHEPSSSTSLRPACEPPLLTTQCNSYLFPDVDQSLSVIIPPGQPEVVQAEGLEDLRATQHAPQQSISNPCSVVPQVIFEGFSEPIPRKGLELRNLTKPMLNEVEPNIPKMTNDPNHSPCCPTKQKSFNSGNPSSNLSSEGPESPELHLEGETKSDKESMIQTTVVEPCGPLFVDHRPSWMRSLRKLLFRRNL